MPPRVLVVDDEEGVRVALRDVLENAGYEVLEAGDGRRALDLITAAQPDAVLLDIRMPELDGMQVLEIVHRTGARTPIILITAYGTTATTIQAMRLGAFDYITKPFDVDELVAVVKKAVETRALLAGASCAGSGVDDLLDAEGLIGWSPAMQAVYKTIGRIVDSDVTVLIRGESGTGKELVARAIHCNSPRKSGPFVKVNCASIPENLLESELFGHEKGAFTGAHARKPGKFELAQRGTIFLDEIGEMSLATQAKLLRVLQEKEFERIGGTETIRADVRILAATNRNLEQAIQNGQFREDLFFRLNVVEVWLPPLREHREDIPILADHFVRHAAREHRKEVLGFSEAALDLLLRYDWPGNIRELKNLCERCVLLASGPLIDVEDLPGNVRDRARQAEVPVRELSLKEAVADTERRLLLEALEKHNWNRSAAAKALKMNRSTLYAKMKELGLL